MLKDIRFEKVEDIAVAVVPEKGDAGEEAWNVYILNLKDNPIDTLLITSRGYGNMKGEQVRTSTLRQFFGELLARAFVKIEPIDRKLFDLCNEFWVSFRYNGLMYDKKYVFVPGSILPENFITVPLLGKRGVMIK